MSNQCLYNHGQCNVRPGLRRILFARARFFQRCSRGLFSLRNAINPDGKKRLWCVPAQFVGTKLRDTYRLKKRNLSADISPNVEGYQDERVRFLLPFDSQFRQHTQGLRI